MEKCIMFEKGIAYRLHLPKGPDFPQKYTQEKGLVLCEIKEDRCPYKQEGKRVTYTDSEMGIACICKSDGLTKPRLELAINKN